MHAGRFNYRVDASPDGDPVAAQGKSIGRLVSLFKRFSQGGGGGAGQQKGGFGSDAKGTFDTSAINTIFQGILADAEARAELKIILKETGRCAPIDCMPLICACSASMIARALARTRVP